MLLERETHYSLRMDTGIKWGKGISITVLLNSRSYGGGKVYFFYSSKFSARVPVTKDILIRENCKIYVIEILHETGAFIRKWRHQEVVKIECWMLGLMRNGISVKYDRTNKKKIISYGSWTRGTAMPVPSDSSSVLEIRMFPSSRYRKGTSHKRGL